MLLPDLYNFLFHLFFQPHLILYAYLVNHTISRVFVRNNINHPIQILKYHKLDCMTKLLYKSCFIVLMDHKVASSLLTSPPLFYEQSSITIMPAGISLKTELLNDIKIYGDKNVMEQISCLVNKYPFI